MATTVASLLVRIAADIEEFQSGLNQADKSLQTTAKAFTDTGSALTKYVSVPLTAMGGLAVKAAADFDQGMANVRSVSGATGEEIAKLSALALQLGADTSFSAVEAATGIEELSKAGLTTQQILEGGLAGALSLAAAGELDLSAAAEIASTALNAFRSENLTVAQAADILAGAANASATSVQEMRYSLAAVSAVASGVGLSFLDTSTALAVFAQNGLKGSDAGTSLKTMLTNLQPTTDKQIALMQRLGLVTADGANAFFTAEGRIKSLDEIAGILQSSMSGLTDAQRLQAIETIFGADAMRAANILFREGEAGVKSMKAAMGNVTAEEVAAIRLDSVNGKVEQFRGSLETAAITIGNVMLPSVTRFIEGLTSMVNWFSELDPRTQRFIVTLAALAAAVGPVLLGIGTAIKIFLSLQAAATALGVTVGALTGTIALAAGGIVAAIAVGVLLIQNWDKIRDAAEALWQTITATFSSGIQSVKTWTSDLGVSFTNTWSGITNAFVRAWASMQRTWDIVSSAVMGSITVTIGDIRSAWDALVGYFTTQFPNDMLRFLQWWVELPGKIGALLMKLAEDAAYWTGFMMGTMLRLIIETGTQIIAWWAALPGYVIAFLSTMAEDAASLIGFMMGTLLRLIIETGTTMIEWFGALPGRVTDLITELRDSSITLFTTMRDTVTQRTREMVDSVVSFVNELPGRVTAAVTNTYTAASEWFTKTYEMGRKQFNDLLWAVGNFIDQVPVRVTAAVTNTYNAAADWFHRMYQVGNQKANDVLWAVGNFFDQMPGRTADALRRVVTAVGDWLEQARGKAVYLGQRMADGFGDAAYGIYTSITGIFSQVLSYVSGLPGQMASKARSIASSFWDSFKKGLGISSPSYVEEAFFAIGASAENTFSDLKQLAPKFRQVAAAMVPPVMPELAAAGTGAGRGVATQASAPVATGDDQNDMFGRFSIQIGQLVVREEADIERIAQRLYQLQQSRRRGVGVR